MRRFKCLICGLEFNEDEALVDEDGTLRCPKCRASQDQFDEIEPIVPFEPTEALEPIAHLETLDSPLPERQDVSIRFLDEIHQMAASGETIVASMGIVQQTPSWDDILLLGAQLDPMPLESDVMINTETVIGRRALKPMVLKGPIYVSHMSFGSLSREAKIALARGSALAHTATCSGEGGILEEEINAAYKYIYEYVPNLYSYSPENLQRADAIEIKIGQGTKPGMGGHLPASKVT
ncbi:MAG: glutamate synthase-related protein, partial [Coriobacteriia bacterium]|nr:glutamate synthase-related protein [Coriobacteriia bacterium]